MSLGYPTPNVHVTDSFLFHVSLLSQNSGKIYITWNFPFYLFFQCTIQWPSVHSQCRATLYMISFQAFSSSPKGNSVSIKQRFPITPFQQPHNLERAHSRDFVEMASYNIYPLVLFYPIWHNVFKIHSRHNGCPTFVPFLWQNNIPLHKHTTLCLSSHLCMDMWVVSTLWLPWIVLCTF